MPTTLRFANCRISIYADDHLPPHFHIEGRGFRALVEIDTMVVRAGDARKAPEALKWARDNIALLRMEWDRLNRRAGHLKAGHLKAGHGEKHAEHQVRPRRWRAASGRHMEGRS